MRRCFISYHHVKPDEDLAMKLATFLKQQNYHVYYNKCQVISSKKSGFFLLFLANPIISFNL